jgi:hypothetical protein
MATSSINSAAQAAGTPTLESLLAPEVAVSTVTAQGGVYSTYEANFTKYAAQHWTSEGASWEAANYYDRAEIFYNWYNRTGDDSYLDKANALAINYRDNYLQANDYAPSAHWSQIAGVALHYVATGDEASRTAVGRVADTFAVPYYLAGAGDATQLEMDNRVQARTLEAFIYAAELDAPSGKGLNWNTLAQQTLDKILSTQDADGAYRFDTYGGNVKPFMTGMLNDTLIDYYNMVEADPRIVTAVKKSLDYLWTNCWDEATQSFKYLENAYGGEPDDPSPDLNNMITAGFGWVYKMTGDETYKERGDQVFAGGVEGAWLEGSKQFNEQYTSSLKYLAYTLGDTVPEAPADPEPTPESDPMPTPTPNSAADEWMEGGVRFVDSEDGNTTLFGKAGNDAFLFTSDLGTPTTDRKVNLDTINDFDVYDDRLWLDNAIFTKLGAGSMTDPTPLKASMFKAGAAEDRNDFILYNKSTGIVSYDADGSGRAYRPVEFAKVEAGTPLTYDDFRII